MLTVLPSHASGSGAPKEFAIQWRSHSHNRRSDRNSLAILEFRFGKAQHQCGCAACTDLILHNCANERGIAGQFHSVLEIRRLHQLGLELLAGLPLLCAAIPFSRIASAGAIRAATPCAAPEVFEVIVEDFAEFNALAEMGQSRARLARAVARAKWALFFIETPFQFRIYGCNNENAMPVVSATRCTAQPFLNAAPAGRHQRLSFCKRRLSDINFPEATH